MKLHIAAWQVILAAVLILASLGMEEQPPAEYEDAYALPAPQGAHVSPGYADTTVQSMTAPVPLGYSGVPGEKDAVQVRPMGMAQPGSAPAAGQQAMAAEPSSAADKPSFRFSVISDIHVEAWSKESHTKLQRALADLAKHAPGRALVINGDLGNGQPKDYEALGKLMRENPYPGQVMYTIGNHEFYKAWTDAFGKWNKAGFPNGETAEASLNRFLQFTGYEKVYHDSWIEGYHFLFLGSETYRQADDSVAEDAWLSEEQLAWLESAMAQGAEEGKPIFVFLHQPLPFTVAGSFTDFNSRAVVQHERLRRILSRYPQTIFFSGHTHWELGAPGTFIRDGFTMVNTSSVLSPYDTSDNPVPAEAKRSEGLVVEVSGNSVDIRGRNFTAGEWIPAATYRVEP